MVAATLPPISPTLQAAIRAYGLANGYKNAAKALAFGPVVNESTQSATVAKRRNGTNGRRSRKLPLACIWFSDDRFGCGGLRYATYSNEAAHSLDASRFTREMPDPFQYARPTTATMLDETDIRLAQYAPRECCGSPMGIMESWGTEVTAVYQCAVNRKHQQEA